jgi:crotonobetainyl-CoA:carnitine CoA-transferase CaiB-like acyl-CoA transferase
MLNEGKRHIVLDLKQDDGRAVLHRMLEQTDILVEQFRPGVMARLGFAPREILERYPKLIIASITGYGQDGPWAHKAGHDLNYLALAGLLSRSCHKEHTTVHSTFQAADIAGGSYYPVTAILGALLKRHKTGLGAHLDISMTEGVIPLGLSNTAPALGGKDLSNAEHTVLQGGCAAYAVYRCADGEHLSLAAIEPKFWMQFCTAVERPEWLAWHLQPSRYEELSSGLIELFSQKPVDEWLRVLAEHDCCVERVIHPGELREHPQHKTRGVFADGPSLRLPAVEALGQQGAPKAQDMSAGFDTRDIMLELGYSAEEIDELLASQVIRCG